MAECDHLHFSASVVVNRLTDSDHFSADVQIICEDCEARMRFLGMDNGSSYNRPMASLDGCEARLPIYPEGKEPPRYGGPTGFQVKGQGR